MDSCGVCAGKNECMGCDGIPHSGKKKDGCGVCGGNGSSCRIKLVAGVAAAGVTTLFVGVAAAIYAYKRRRMMTVLAEPASPPIHFNSSQINPLYEDRPHFRNNTMYNRPY